MAITKGLYVVPIDHRLAMGQAHPFIPRGRYGAIACGQPEDIADIKTATPADAHPNPDAA